MTWTEITALVFGVDSGYGLLRDVTNHQLKKKLFCEWNIDPLTVNLKLRYTRRAAYNRRKHWAINLIIENYTTLQAHNHPHYSCLMIGLALSIPSEVQLIVRIRAINYSYATLTLL